MADKRSLERKKTGVFFGLYNREDSKYVGRLVDINTKGLMIIGKVQFKTGLCFKLKMDLPQEINGKSQIEFDAKVIWCEKCKHINLFSCGLEFLVIDPVYSQLIDELIASPFFNDPAAALPLSVNIGSIK